VTRDVKHSPVSSVLAVVSLIRTYRAEMDGDE
jgi:hypothetical protein